MSDQPKPLTPERRAKFLACARKLPNNAVEDSALLYFAITELDAELRRVEGLLEARDAALDTIQGDPHQWSKRPCPTCRAITTTFGRDFGCTKYASALAAKEPTP